MSNIVFRFRVTFEDVDDVERIIDVSGKNTFRDFHTAIQDAIGFDKIKEASFFKANDLWRPYEEFCTEPKANAKAAGASPLARFIDDPHQKFLYVYDPEGGQWSLRAEVLRLLKEEAGTQYPLLYKSIGIAPKQFTDPKLIIDDPSAKFFKEADDLIQGLGDQFDEEDLKGLEGEEGNEEEQEEDIDLSEDDSDEIGL